jgi:transposase
MSRSPSSMQRSTPFGGMPTRSVTSCPTRSRSSTPSTSSSWPGTSSTRSAAVSSKTPRTGADTRTTRSTGSAGRCSPARNTSPNDNEHGSRKYLPVGDPTGEVEVAWRIYQSVRGIYNASSPSVGRERAEKLLDVLHTCPLGEVARLGRSLRQWRQQILAYFTTEGVNNGGTEAINLIIEKTRRPAHGFRNFEHYRLRILLAADGSRPYRRRPQDPVNHA